MLFQFYECDVNSIYELNKECIYSINEEDNKTLTVINYSVQLKIKGEVYENLPLMLRKYVTSYVKRRIYKIRITMINIT